MKTRLGWIISGATSHQSYNHRAVLTANLQVTDVDLNATLRKFWEIEELPNDYRILTEDEILCEEYYRNTVKRNSEGRYVVRLPLKPDTPEVWNGSPRLALKMFSSLEHKFRTNSSLRAAYSQSTQEYLELGHMRHVLRTNRNVDQCFFLPHHGVIKESSSTTRLRTVFNSSATTKGDKCLNDFLLVGHNLLTETIDLLTNW